MILQGLRMISGHFSSRPEICVSFMSVELIWQQVLDWRLDSSGMCRYTYIPAIPYLYLLRSYCVHFNILRFHYTTLETLSIRSITEYFISWTLLYTSITQHYWVVVTYNFSSINFNWYWLQFTYVLFIDFNIPDCCHISLEFNIKGSASHVVVELPLNLKIISGMIRQHSIDSIRAFPTTAQCGQSRDPENPENKH